MHASYLAEVLIGLRELADIAEIADSYDFLTGWHVFSNRPQVVHRESIIVEFEYRSSNLRKRQLDTRQHDCNVIGASNVEKCRDSCLLLWFGWRGCCRLWCIVEAECLIKVC